MDLRDVGKGLKDKRLLAEKGSITRNEIGIFGVMDKDEFILRTKKPCDYSRIAKASVASA